MPGRLMSIRITSGREARARSMPSVPFTAPNRRRSDRRAINSSTSFRLAGLSSTQSKVRSRALVGAGVAAAYGWGDVGAVLGAVAGVAVGLLIGRFTGWVPHMEAQRKE